MRQPLPTGEPQRFAFDAACDETGLSWNPPATEGLAFSAAMGERTAPLAWRVDFTTRSIKKFDLSSLPGGAPVEGKEGPSLVQLGFDTQGRPQALVADVYVQRTPESGEGGGRFLTFEGQRYPVADGSSNAENAPGLAFAYRMEGAAWKRIETKVSSFGSQDAPDVSELDAAKKMLDQTVSSSGALPGKPSDKALAHTLETTLIEDPTDEEAWRTLPTPGAVLHYRVARDPEDDSNFASLPLRWERDGALVSPEPLAAQQGERLMLQARGAMVLIVSLSEAGRTAQVFDSQTQKSLVRVQGVDAPTLWPQPTSPAATP
ncbi:hypothetical protein D7W81_18555 [Corallococcus aberystwythensis]|uniref:Uncharacterized protein n=2 Tax=Corallococcus aberystwythensis TaxID=2316722 RepID=A0A3A8Q744_9BACT|nr:hypothetical protein D7W81_18555 [Corallococcus aberystwythensis]